jgi:hypothetical protein
LTNKATEKKAILPEDPEAAKRTRMAGWISRDGYFYPDKQTNADAESLARANGSTHKRCECGVVFEKCCWIKCPACRAKEEAERVANFPRQEWDGSSPLYSEAYDLWFYSYSQVEDFLADKLAEQQAEGIRDEEETLDFDDLDPRICEPVKVRQLDEDSWYDDLPEDGPGPGPRKTPAALTAAIEAFNAATKDLVLSWTPCDIVATEAKDVVSAQIAAVSALASSPVAHPGHYTWIPGIECADVSKHFSSMTGQAIQYIWRHRHKGKPIEDLEKAVCFLQIEIEKLKGEVKK